MIVGKSKIITKQVKMDTMDQYRQIQAAKIKEMKLEDLLLQYESLKLEIKDLQKVLHSKDKEVERLENKRRK